MTVRTRFAPSPTGSLHIGSVRVALYCWLYAKNRNGKFILRIEDTDQERSTQEATQVILDSMKWLGLDYAEGPFYQTKRLDRYREIANNLLTEGKAYRCYCTKERIDKLREEQFAKKIKPRYDGHCRNLNLPHRDEPYVIRFKNPEAGTISFQDQVLGEIQYQSDELDDLIIMRSDQFPTYNFCVVIDDMDMRVTHVIRGADHVNNTPRQINIFHALGVTPPLYAHVPLILGKDGKLLSKRHGATSVLQYRDDGFLPEALLNYLVRLGWSHGDQEIFSSEEMIKFFDIKDVNKAAACFDPEKLLWLNRHYIKTLEPLILVPILQEQLKQLGIDFSSGPNLADIIIALRERAGTMKEMAEMSRVFFVDFSNYDEAAKKHLTPENIVFLRTMRERLENLNLWSDENLHQIVEDIAKDFNLKLGKVAQPLRVAVTGGTVSPPINVTLRLLGKEKTLLRLDRAISL